MGEEIFTFLRESKYSVSLITVPFCPVAPCPFKILAGVLHDGRCGCGTSHKLLKETTRKNSFAYQRETNTAQ